MSTITYSVSYRIKGNNGLSKLAIVVVDQVQSHEHVKAVIANENMVSVDMIVDFHPVLLRSNSVIPIRIC
jgi:hypothetical protein